MEPNNHVLDVLKPGIVQIVAPKHSQRERPYFITPFQDPNTNEYVTGSEIEGVDLAGVSAEKKKRLQRIEKLAASQLINSTEQVKKENDGRAVSEQVPITHLLKLDRSVDKDCVLLNLIRISRIVAPSKKAYNGQEHYYYIDDVNAEAEQIVTEIEELSDSLEAIKKLSDKDYGAYYRYLTGNESRGQNTSLLKRGLLEYAQKNPSRCLKALKVDDLSVRILAHKFIEHGIIYHDVVHQTYKRGDSMISQKFDDLVKYLKDEKNSTIFETFSNELAAKEGKAKPATAK